MSLHARGGKKDQKKKKVIGLYQQQVNILSQRGFAVAKQQECRNQSCSCFLKGVLFAVSSLCAIPYDLQRLNAQDFEAEKTKRRNTCRCPNFQITVKSSDERRRRFSTKIQENIEPENKTVLSVQLLWNVCGVYNFSKSH